MLDLLKMKVKESKSDEDRSVKICLLPCSRQRGDGIQGVIGKMSVKIFKRENNLDATLPNIKVVVTEFIDGIEA